MELLVIYIVDLVVKDSLINAVKIPVRCQRYLPADFRADIKATNLNIFQDTEVSD